MDHKQQGCLGDAVVEAREGDWRHRSGAGQPWFFSSPVLALETSGNVSVAPCILWGPHAESIRDLAAHRWRSCLCQSRSCGRRSISGDYHSKSRHHGLWISGELVVAKGKRERGHELEAAMFSWWRGRGTLG